MDIKHEALQKKQILSNLETYMLVFMVYSTGVLSGTWYEC